MERVSCDIFTLGVFLISYLQSSTLLWFFISLETIRLLQCFLLYIHQILLVPSLSSNSSSFILHYSSDYQTLLPTALFIMFWRPFETCIPDEYLPLHWTWRIRAHKSGLQVSKTNWAKGHLVLSVLYFYSLADLSLLAFGNPLQDNQLGCSHHLLASHRSTGYLN